MPLYEVSLTMVHRTTKRTHRLRFAACAESDEAAIEMVERAYDLSIMETLSRSARINTAGVMHVPDSAEEDDDD